MSNLVIIEVIQGEVLARQIESEFKILAGEGSTWRWYAKKIGEKKYQMRFPNAQTLATASHFREMKLRSARIGSKGVLDAAWFRITGIPVEKRSIPKVCRVASLVGKAKQVDEDNMFKWEYVRVKVQCRDANKVPAVVEGALGDYLYDFGFQREIPQIGTTNPAENQWVRNYTVDDQGNQQNKKTKDGW